MIDIKLPIKELGLNTRALNYLTIEANIKTIEDLILHESRLIKYPNIGNVTDAHIKEKLAIHNLYLKTDRQFLKKQKKKMTNHTLHICFVINPNILPSLEEWKLICKMIKRSEQ